ncbi:MAG TPA: alpha/beta hydrolase [Baekduia sp.]|nr:alpha/beta hydrolase [Baekduia sp.]
MSRTEVEFWSGRERCAGWLWRPEDDGADVGCVVLAHGFGGVREARLWAFAERFAQAGFAALVFDYRHFGASGGEPRQLLDIGRQHEDWRAAIAFARSLDGVDADRVAAWGTSFSAGHVMVLAAQDPRLAAAISMNPFVDGLPTLAGMHPPTIARLTAAAIADLLARATGRPPVEVPIVAQPGELAVMNGPGALRGYEALFEPGDELVNRVCARIALRVGTYRPTAKAPRIRCPWLVQVGDQDDVTPPGPALRAARKAPHAEVRHFGGGHFDPYVGETFEQVVGEQVAFLQRHLAPATARTPAMTV